MNYNNHFTETRIISPHFSSMPQRHNNNTALSSTTLSSTTLYHRISAAGLWTCKVCNQQFRDVYVYSDHLQCVHLKVKRFQCPTCGHASFKKDNITKHILKRDHGSCVVKLRGKVKTLEEVERAIDEMFFVCWGRDCNRNINDIS